MLDINRKNFIKFIEKHRKDGLSAKLVSKIINIGCDSVYHKISGQHKVYDFEVIAIKAGYYKYLKEILSKLEEELRKDKIL